MKGDVVCMGLSLCQRAAGTQRIHRRPSPLHLPPGVHQACQSFRHLDPV